MTTFVVLLRGINVGSTRKLPMADLCALCEELGLRGPQTYIQSGNLIVESSGNADGLRKILERELAARLHFAPNVIVRDAAAWHAVVAANPFAGDAKAVPKAVHLYLSRAALAPGARVVLEERARKVERVRAAGGGLWIDYGNEGIAGSKLTPALIDKACGSPATGRNLNTLQQIGLLLAARK